MDNAKNMAKSYETHLQEIYDESYWEFSTKVDSNVTGQYDLNTKNIIIYTKNNYAWYILEVTYHETAHYIWYEFLNDSLRNEYFNIFNESNWFVSKYAMENEKEDFAESFMNWALDKNRLDEKRLDFMEENVRELI